MTSPHSQFFSFLKSDTSALEGLLQQQQWELYDNHVAKKQQEQLQHGHFQFVTRKRPKEIVRKGLSLKQKSVQIRCRAVVSAEHLPCHACLARNPGSVLESGRGQ